MAVGECWVCGKVRPVKRKRFMILWYWITDLICEQCFNQPDEDKDGNWEDEEVAV